MCVSLHTCIHTAPPFSTGLHFLISNINRTLSSQKVLFEVNILSIFLQGCQLELSIQTHFKKREALEVEEGVIHPFEEKVGSITYRIRNRVSDIKLNIGTQEVNFKQTDCWGA